jgi:hypothetical protein
MPFRQSNLKQNKNSKNIENVNKMMGFDLMYRTF